MEQTTIKKFLNTPFIIECSSIENEPGTWDSTKVSIYRDDILIGEYLRNYNNYGTLTFYPFKQGDDWYALYSASYTATRVMKLHNDRIEDWCGEEDNPYGFCPVEIYIPQYIHRLYKDEFDIFYTDADLTEEEIQEELDNPEFVKTEYCNFGFVCGCVWGDDSSWKIRYIDLDQIPNKVLSITEKFGYWEMPENLTLKQCINMKNWEPGCDWISLIRAENINLTTGERG